MSLGMSGAGERTEVMGLSGSLSPVSHLGKMRQEGESQREVNGVTAPMNGRESEVVVL